jgi:putative ABC transport system permease protein
VPEFTRQPWATFSVGLLVTPLQQDVARGVRPALLAVIGAVLLVLAIACVNVTNLLLARGAQRRGEFAMRVALGAGRGRLTRQLLTETIVLAGVGGVLGIGVAAIGVRALVALSPAGLPRVGAIHVDVGVVAFALAIALVVGIAVGVIPAFSVAHNDLLPGLQQSSQRAVGGHQRARSTLVVAEVALALVLLVGAGLLLRSLQRLFAVSPGFEAAQLLTMQVQVSGRKFQNDQARVQFFADALEAVKQVPGVQYAALTSQLPLSGDLEKFGISYQSIPEFDPNEDLSAFRYAVTPEYLATMRIPLRRGRMFDARDMRGGPERPVLISESLARKRFPGRDAMGERIRFGGNADRPWDVIVGVVGDVKQVSLAMRQADAVYVPSSTWLWVDNPLWFVVRARTGDASALAPAVQRAIWSVDKGQPIVRVSTMDAQVAATAAERRFAMILFEAFALAALVLAAIGIYGVLAGRVTERTREIGVRAALGASPRDVVGLIVRQGMTLTATGVAIGLLGAVLASRALIALLFGISRLDVVTYAGVIALLLGVSVLACLLPAWRAARVDPSITLRSE